MKSCLILFCLCLILSPFESQAGLPKYILNCAKLLENLQQIPISIATPSGRPATEAEIASSPGLAEWMQGQKGQLLRLDDEEHPAMQFRWSAPGGPSEFVMAYADEKHAKEKDRQLAVIVGNLPSGLFEALPQLGKFGNLRFYRDIEAITLEHLLHADYYSAAMKFEIVRLYTKQLTLFRDKIIERYGAENVKEIKEDWNFEMIAPDLLLQIQTPDQGRVEVWIHGDHILFDERTKTFWFLDTW